MTKQLTSNELKEKIQNKENFVLDLFATWCGPCKIMLGNLEKVNESLVKEPKGSPNFNVYKFDIEQDMDLMKEWGVRGVPTIKIFRDGEEVFSKPGVMSPDQVLNLLN
jgi:thioredoxin 1